MTLIKSISGIRGTIGGYPDHNLSPIDIVKITSAYGLWIIKNNYKKNYNKKKYINIGRDARKSGLTISYLVISTLQNLGINIIDLGISTTPTIKLSIIKEKSIGGIIISASHNPKNWNALKLLDQNGEPISNKILKYIIKYYNNYKKILFVQIKKIGIYIKKNNYIYYHIQKILKLSLVNIQLIKKRNYKIVIYAMNSSGSIAIPMLLQFLGIKNIIKISCDLNKDIPNNPEPIDKNLRYISKKVLSVKADLGIVVDPDVDRLVFISEKGKSFGEEYTIVAIADYILNNKIGPIVSNISSSKALEDLIKKKPGALHYYSSVGEINVIKKMKEVNAIFGGEGNGGVIYPDLHYGRDALVGIALFLSYLAYLNISISKMKKKYSKYFISKKKINMNIYNKKILNKIYNKYYNNNTKVDTSDGLKIQFINEWVHIRISNTESIIRIYAESITKKNAEKLANKFINEIKYFNKKNFLNY